MRIEKWNREGDFGKWQFTTAATLRKNDVHPIVFAPEENDPDMSTLEAKEMEAWLSLPYKWLGVLMLFLKSFMKRQGFGIDLRIFISRKL